MQVKTYQPGYFINVLLFYLALDSLKFLFWYRNFRARNACAVWFLGKLNTDLCRAGLFPLCQCRVSAGNHRKTSCTDNQCLKAIDPDHVFNRIKSVLDRRTIAWAS
ncbi:MAG: hypothetical protein ACPG5T_03570 [Endozoicomonas sp.]